MKIKSENVIYNIPISNGICILAGNYVDDLIDDFNSYFVKGKKNKCVIIDDEGDLINQNDTAFIYIPKDEDLSQIYDFKPKTIINSEVTKFINENQDKFQSIEMIRKASRELLTDSGFYRLIEILRNNLQLDIDFIINDFDISRLLQMYALNNENLSIQQQFAILYNLLMFINRVKFLLIYIDYEIDDFTLEWLSNIKSDNSIIFLRNESIRATNVSSIDAMILLSPYDFVEERESYSTNINEISYCFNQYTLRNYMFQTEKNQQIIREFQDEKSTFFIKFICQELSTTV